jgi:hypothetical protein
LESQLKHCFLDNAGPGHIPQISSTQTSLTGVIVPHAGLSCSGSIAAHSYARIAESGFADVFIILGPNHRGLGSGVAMYPEGVWETPLGTTAIDERIVKHLAGGIIDTNASAHEQQENSIEVQLPFLQYLGKQHTFTIVPIAMAMQDYQTGKEVGEQLATVIAEDDRRIQIIASTDFSHEGMAYGRMNPSDIPVNEYVSKQDQKAIDCILHNDAKGLIETIQQENISMCGYGPVIALLTAAKTLSESTVELLKYGTSYDVFPDSSACVGYGSFAIT